jgi:formate dehydrogenase gamma subunit
MTTWIERFSVRQRVEHVGIMLLFLLLAVTGFPQKFFEAGWAQWTIVTLGGIDRLRWLHRMAGVAFSILAAVHLLAALGTALLSRSSWSMVPGKQDFADAVGTLKYYLGMQNDHPRFDRYDYRQKFEYWGLVLGGSVMIVTGFVLYFPVFFTRLLPGEMIPASKVAHSSEGLLAFLVVIVWHIYNAHLSPDVFPFDTSIFTGKVSAERMAHEHPLEYDRLIAAGQAPAPHVPLPVEPDGHHADVVGPRHDR